MLVMFACAVGEKIKCFSQSLYMWVWQCREGKIVKMVGKREINRTQGRASKASYEIYPEAVRSIPSTLLS